MATTYTLRRKMFAGRGQIELAKQVSENGTKGGFKQTYGQFEKALKAEDAAKAARREAYQKWAEEQSKAGAKDTRMRAFLTQNQGASAEVQKARQVSKAKFHNVADRAFKNSKNPNGMTAAQQASAAAGQAANRGAGMKNWIRRTWAKPAGKAGLIGGGVLLAGGGLLAATSGNRNRNQQY